MLYPSWFELTPFLHAQLPCVYVAAFARSCLAFSRQAHHLDSSFSVFLCSTIHWLDEVRSSQS